MDDSISLRSWFDRIDQTEIVQMHDRREAESIHLEFKTLAHQSFGTQDVENLKIALSGFANSMGGIILWGVSTKSPEKKETHRFASLEPLADGHATVTRLIELTTHATHPAVCGVAHEPIRVERGWVVKTFVPPSDRVPHRTNDANGQYYKRGADNFVPMWHYEIADMFGRRTRPNLVLVVRPKLARGYILIGLHNDGRGIAKYPYIWFNVEPNPYKISRHELDDNGASGLRRIPGYRTSKTSAAYGGGVDDVIHSGETRWVTKVQLEGRVGPDTVLPELVLTYQIAAEGIERRTAIHKESSERLKLLYQEDLRQGSEDVDSNQ
jgi:hypothetical protein